MENATPIPPEGQTPSDAPNDAAGYESRDISVRAIVIFMVTMFASAAVIHWGVWGLMGTFERHNAANDHTPSPFADRHAPPPEPRLQPSVAHAALPYEDMNALKARWKAELSSYGVVEGRPERGRIPIDRAMELFVQRGLAASNPPTTQAEGAK